MALRLPFTITILKHCMHINQYFGLIYTRLLSVWICLICYHGVWFFIE